jgi:hypothetical protein
LGEVKRQGVTAHRLLSDRVEIDIEIRHDELMKAPVDRLAVAKNGEVGLGHSPPAAGKGIEGTALKT